MLLYQVYTGSKQGSSSITSVEDTSKIEIGHLIAVYCDNYANEPAIAKCMEISESEVKVTWMKGTYSSAWKTWMIRDPSNHRKMTEWSDWIPLSSILLFDFQLTPSGHLRKQTITHLKKEYAKIH